MDMEDPDEAASGSSDLEPREPTLEDLVVLCRDLNAQGARYVVVGGFAVRAAGHIRSTMDIDFLIATGAENEALVFKGLASLPDQAVLELQPGEVGQYVVVRVADDITVDLMKSACGIDYAEASQHVVVREVDGVSIPFASPLLLWRMKKPTRREKDIPDLIFLRRLLESQGITPPE